MESYNDATATSTNWMYMGLYDWTISRNADNSNRAFFVNYAGYVLYYFVYNYGLYGDGVSYNNGVRPSFNLLSSITYVSGSGSASDPMVIN